MKAYVLHAINNFPYEELALPSCPEGWVLVKVKASGICSSDIARIFTKGTYHFPTIPGHEFAGIVESVGSAKDQALVGKHVGVFPLIPCRNCTSCQEKRYEMCANYDYVGSRRDGGYAEFVAVPVWNLIELPKNIPFTSAAMLEPLAVGLHAAKMAHIQPRQSVAIIGTGMIGICAAQWAKALGAGEVVVIGRNETKRSLVESAELRYVIQTSKDAIDQYDIVIEAVGTPDAIELSVYAVKAGGTLVLMGNPSGDITLTQNAYWRILRQQITLRGTWNSSYDGINPSDWTEVVAALEAKKIKVEHLITHCYPQEGLMEGLNLMKNHKEPYCKIMTTWND